MFKSFILDIGEQKFQELNGKPDNGSKNKEILKIIIMKNEDLKLKISISKLRQNQKRK